MSLAIILFSHGSLLCGAGETLRLVAERMGARGDAPIVEVGYLNYSEPTLAVAFERCVDRGATEIVIVPYFLVAGKFVRVDLPRAIKPVRERYPEIAVRVAEAMRYHPLLADALLGCASRALPLAEWRASLEPPTTFCRRDPRCPRYGSAGCLAAPAEPVL